MTASEGVYGNSGIVAKFLLGVGPAKEFDNDIKKVRIVPEDKDDSDLTFEEAASGETKNYKVNITAIQSLAALSFWRFLWENPGAEIVLTYGPGGNAVATADKPHFVMTIKANGKPELGAEAKRTKERAEFDYEFEVTAGPTLDDGS